MKEKTKRKRHDYKFAQKTHSLRGFLALSLAAASITIGMVLLVLTFHNDGSSSVYFGSGGLVALVIALAAFILGIISLQEEASYKGLPAAGMITSFIALAGWIGIYVIGFLV